MDIAAAWTDEAHLAASQFDATQIGNWQRGGGEGAKPKRLERPGDAALDKAKADSIAAKASRFAARQAAAQPPVKKQPRDARGRFVKEGS